MNIHSAIKFGAQNSIKVSPSHNTNNNSHTKSQPSHADAQTNTTNTKEVSKTEQALTPTPQNTPPTTPVKAETKPSFKAVDLNIAGTSHRINCPVDEVSQLEQAGQYINSKIREIRRDTKGKSLSNEELLVLVCLELYDQQEALKHEHKNQILNNERARAIIEKITKDARSVL